MQQYRKIGWAVLGAVAIGMLALVVFSVQQALLIAVISLLVVLWTNSGLPLGVVSLLPILLFPVFGILPTGDVVTNYSKSIIFLFLGGFFIAIATEKTGLHKIVADRLLRIFPQTAFGIILAFSLSAALLSAIISNTTTALLLIPIASFLTDSKKMKMRLILAVAYGCSIGGIMTPIGTPPNMIFMGFAETNHLLEVSFFQWMVYMMPLSLLMLLVMSKVLSIGISLSALNIDKQQEKPSVKPEHKRLLYYFLALLLLLVINSPIEPYYSGLGLNEKLILLGAGLLLFFPKIGFLSWQDSKKVPYEIIFLFGAGFSIAMAFTATGLSEAIAGYLKYLNTLPFFFILLIVATLVTFMTEIVSNTALISVILPIIYVLFSHFDANHLLVIQLVTTICASFAFMMPIATPPNAIAMSTGEVSIREMAKYGFLLNLVGILLVSLFAYLVWL